MDLQKCLYSLISKKVVFFYSFSICGNVKINYVKDGVGINVAEVVFLVICMLLLFLFSSCSCLLLAVVMLLLCSMCEM